MSVVRLICVLFVAGVSARSIRSTDEKTENEVTSLRCNCDRRYWAHYEARGCHPVFEENKLDCPTRFDCPDLPESNSEGCLFRGTHYSIGSNIETGNSCDDCYCRGDKTTNSSFITCAIVDCAEDLNGELEDGCHYVYTKDSCCSVGTECETKESFTCDWNNKTYYRGERIHVKEDPCLICTCTENWEGLTSKSCRKVDCLIEKQLHLLQQGCVPIYHEKTCCPIDYHCPKEIEQNEKSNVSVTVEKEPHQCYFDGRAYNKGEVLYYNHTVNCVTCTCCVPPDFTCIYQFCPKPSGYDYNKCHIVVKEGVCCPEYVCSEQTAAKISDEREVELVGPPIGESPCADLHCEEGEHCQLKQICKESSCPIFPQCVAINVNCPTPQCDAGCYVVDGDKDRCPTCVCGNNSLTGKSADERCTLPNCTGSNCHLVANRDSCPVCSCDPPCPVCPPNCQTQTETSEGRCPDCICNDIFQNNAEPVSCPTPICDGINCTMKTGEDNCTQCVCQACSPPKCDPGCKVGIDASGGCPKCECPASENIENIPCPVPVCRGFNCTMKVGEDNCTHCVCLECSTPKCEPNCKLENNVSGGCPKCNCPDNENANDHTTTEAAVVTSTTEAQKCPELKCRGYNCRILIGTDGCQFCTCESKCPPTKCIPGCFVDQNPLPDQCPGCICHIAATPKDLSNES